MTETVKDGRRTKRLTITAGLLVLAGLGGFFMFRFLEQEAPSPQASLILPPQDLPARRSGERPGIDYLEILSTEEGLEVVVRIPGPAEGDYVLSLTGKAQGYLQTLVFSWQQRIHLLLKKQEFHIPVTFEAFAQRYHERLAENMVALPQQFGQEQFGIDEFISFEATIRPTGSRSLQSHQERGNAAASAFVRFYFSCDAAACAVIQRDPVQESAESLEADRGDVAEPKERATERP